MSDDITAETAATTPAPFKPLHRGLGVGLQYDSDALGASFYHLYARAADNVWHHVATVSVDHEDRSIALGDPAGHKIITTNGIASWTFSGDNKRVNGRSVANYVLPRAGMLLGRLYAIASA